MKGKDKLIRNDRIMESYKLLEDGGYKMISQPVTPGLTKALRKGAMEFDFDLTKGIESEENPKDWCYLKIVFPNITRTPSTDLPFSLEPHQHGSFYLLSTEIKIDITDPAQAVQEIDEILKTSMESIVEMSLQDDFDLSLEEFSDYLGYNNPIKMMKKIKDKLKKAISDFNSHRHAVEGRRCYKDHNEAEFGCTTTEPLTHEEYQEEIPPSRRDKPKEE